MPILDLQAENDAVVIPNILKSMLGDRVEHKTIAAAGWVITLHLTTHLHCTCPLICIRLDQLFASDLTSTLGGPDWQKSTQSSPLRKAAYNCGFNTLDFV